MMMFILLLFSTLLHSVYSQLDPGVDSVLYEAIQKAVVKDESNLLTLQDIFYLPDNSNKQIQFRIPECSFMVAVKNNTHPDWSNCSHCDSDLPSGYYCNDKDVYIGNYSDIKSKELFSYVEATTRLRLDLCSVRLFNLLTNQNLAIASSSVTNCELSINIDDELDSLPDFYEVEDTLQAVFFWVCNPLPPSLPNLLAKIVCLIARLVMHAIFPADGFLPSMLVLYNLMLTLRYISGWLLTRLFLRRCQESSLGDYHYRYVL